MPVTDIRARFYSVDNFRLAWERVLRSQHAENKDRIALRVFASGLDYNISRLVCEIQTGVYSPAAAPKLYLPKPARTLRTISVLSVRDRIVYQAIGNLVTQEAAPDLSVVSNRHVFAHLPQHEGSLFPLMRWQKQIRRFINKYEQIWKQGNRWVVEADISAYYDSIEHKLLLALIRDRWIADEEFLGWLGRCLRSWTVHADGPKLGSGVPQGYETSDLLATLFLLPLDESMVQDTRYLRYVDDIRILSPNRDAASRALVKLDLRLKTRALVLQTRKTGLQEIKSMEDERNGLRHRLSIVNMLIGQGNNQQTELQELFFEAWREFDESPNAAESTLMFALYRLGPDEAVRDVAIRLLDMLPWRSGVVNRYLERFADDQVVVQELMSALRTQGVYGWHLANCMRAIAKVAHPSVYRGLALEWVANRNLQWFQRLAAVEALQEDPDSHAALSTAIRSEDNVGVRRALITACAFQAQKAGSKPEVAFLIRHALEDTDIEVQLLGTWLRQQFPDVSWDEINSQSPLGPLRPLIPEFAGATGESPCFIKHTLRTLYGVTIAEALDFRTLFDDYSGAVFDLRKAVPHYHTDPSLYIGLINSFNHRTVMALKKVVGSTVPDHEFDNMLKSSQFRSMFPQVSLYFGRCNALRNQTTGFHPFATALGTWSQPVKHAEKEALHKGLKLAYQELVDVHQKSLGIT